MNRRDASITDLERRVSGQVLIGTVSQVDHAKGRYRVKAGDIETDWIPMTTSRAGSTRTYSSLDEGEQVVVASPSGDLAQGVIIGSVATEERQAADAGNLHRTIYPDGTVAEYDHEAKAYRIAVADGGAFALSIGGGASITGSGDGLTIKAATVRIEGALEVEGGSLTHNGTNVGGDHKHQDVSRGSDTTGEPV